MKRNPLIPFALIAVIGIALIFIFSFQGLKQANELASAKNGGAPAQTAAVNPEDTIKQTCTTCHGSNLEGSVGPNLQKIGNKYTADQIKTILLNGKGNMPAGLVPADQAQKVAEYLAAKNK